MEPLPKSPMLAVAAIFQNGRHNRMNLSIVLSLNQLTIALRPEYQSKMEKTFV